jgi:DNA helicase-2/ATP-dependent DNA helicase PcrA
MAPKNQNGLNPEQKKAAEAPISPLLIVAGAGTGKTKTLTSRIVHLIASGIPPERICAITFTNKAAAEMASRISVMTGVAGRTTPRTTPYIGTFHSLGARILRRECRILGREPNFAIFDDHDSLDLIKKALKTIAGPSKESKKKSPALFAKKISELKNLPEERVFEKRSNDREEIKSAFAAYEAALQRNNAFDFDDLIEKPVAIFRAHPEILRRHQDKFDAILVDEYQDINPKQYEFISLLAGAHRNLTVVGDDEQTIYTWRFADIKIFLDFDKDWPEAVVHFLEENYRSTGNIIRGASAVVQNNRFRTPKKLWTKQDAGEPITIYEAWGENDEAAWIAGEVTKARQIQNSGLAADEKPAVAILYRTNAQSRAIEQALIRENIPYKIFGGLKFYERREVKDAVAALRYAANSRDELSRERLEKNLSKRKFAEFRAAVSTTTGLKPTDIIKLFLKTFDYFEYLEGNFINADERTENITELINFASGFDSLPELLERLSLLQATDDENAAAKSDGGDAQHAKAVHLSTIHMAKGLEFDAVFIAGAAEGILPHIRSIDNDASLEEERRLMYVAMTRARKKLAISFYGLPSRFIAEIPEEHVALAGDADGDTEDDMKNSAPPKRSGKTTFDPYSRDDDFYVEENVVDF